MCALFLGSEFWTNFWTNFWPNFASTLCGIVIGLPFALWTNRQAISGQIKRQKEADKVRLDNALNIIKQTLAENCVRLRTTKSIFETNKFQFETEYDTSTWDALKNDIVLFLNNLQLQKRIAYNFTMLISFVATHRLYLEQNFGVAIAIRALEPNKQAFKNHILRMIDFLLSDSEQVIEQIDVYMQTKV